MEFIDLIAPFFGFFSTIALKLLVADFAAISGTKAMTIAVGVAIVMRIVGPLPAVLAAALTSGASGPEDNKTGIIKYTVLLLTALALGYFALRLLI